MLKFDSTFAATLVVICTVGCFTAIGSFSYARYPAPKLRHAAKLQAKADPVELIHGVFYSDRDRAAVQSLWAKAERDLENRRKLMDLFSATPEGK